MNMSDENTGTPSLSDRVDAALSEPPPAALADAPWQAGYRGTGTAGEGDPIDTGTSSAEVKTADDETPMSTHEEGSLEAIVDVIGMLRTRLNEAQRVDYKPLLHVALQRLDDVAQAAEQAFAPAV